MRYIGVDLHTNSFTLCILEEGCPEHIQTLPLQKGGLETFLKGLRPEDEVALEATGNSAWFRDQLLPHVARVAIIAPWQFEVIRWSVKKTDKHDARTIAFFLSKDMIPEARLKSKDHTQLASLIALRDQMVKLRVSLLNRVHGLKVKKEALTSRKGFERETSAHSWDALEQIEIEVIAGRLESLKQSCVRLEKEITAFAKTLPGYENLVSIKGIGSQSAAVFLCTIGDIEDFAKTGNLAACFGIVPKVSNSNDTQRVGRITKRGSKIARTALVQCTLIAKRYSPYLHDFYEHIKKTRGAGKAIIAMARKLLNTIFYTLKNGWVFEDFPNFVIKQNQCPAGHSS